MAAPPNHPANGRGLFTAEDVRSNHFLRQAADQSADIAEAVRSSNRWLAGIMRAGRWPLLTPSQAKEVLGYLSQFGFTAEQIRTMCKRCPLLLTCGGGYSRGKLKMAPLLRALEEYGFSRRQVMHICARRPSILAYTWERLYGEKNHPSVLKRLNAYGFTRQQIISMCVRSPSLLSYSWARMHGSASSPGIIRRLELFGFSKPQVMRVCSSFPQILGYAWSRTHGTPGRPGILLRFLRYGLTREEVVTLCVAVPVVLGCRWERTRSQLELANRLDLPRSMQLFLFAPEKTEWRWNFLTKRCNLPPNEARRVLFRRRHDFLRQFGTDYLVREDRLRLADDESPMDPAAG